MNFLDYIMGDGYADWLALTGGFSTRKSYEGETIPQMEEFMSFNPQIVERILEPDEVTAIANKAQITWKDLAINSIDSGLEAAADELNGKWARAREK